MSEVLRQLHWLLVKKRTEYKVLVLIHCEGTPVYVALLMNRHTARRSLRSVGDLLLHVPRVNLEQYGRRALACAGPTLWNALPATKTYIKYIFILKLTCMFYTI